LPARVSRRASRRAGIACAVPAERYVIIEGRGLVEVGDLPATEVGVGDAVLIPPECPQRITNTGSVDLVFLAICTPRFMSQAYEDIEDEIVQRPAR